MFVIIGIVIVIAAILGGYLMEHGNIRVLLQPAELVIIGGAALGTVLIGNPLHILKKIVGGLAGVFGSSKYGKVKYLESLKMLYELFSRARKEGLMALESDSDYPEQSPVFSKYPKFLKDHHELPFVCDTIRMAAGGGIEPFDVDQMIENDMEAHHHDATQPVAALARTFLGILLCYGFIGPIAANMMKATEEEHAFYQVMRVVIVSFIKGSPPTVAVEFGRRAIPGNVRPSFQEVEKYIKGRGDEAAAPAEK